MPERINGFLFLYSNHVIRLFQDCSLQKNWSNSDDSLTSQAQRETETWSSPERNPLKRKQITSRPHLWGPHFLSLFFRNKKQIYGKLSLYNFWACIKGEFLILLLGQEKSTARCRDTNQPPEGPMQSTQPQKQLALAGTYGTAPKRLQPQSALLSVTLPHPAPDASSSESRYQHHFAAVGGMMSVEVSPHRKQDWFVLNVKKFFTAVKELTLVT